MDGKSLLPPAVLVISLILVFEALGVFRNYPFGYGELGISLIAITALIGVVLLAGWVGRRVYHKPADLGPPEANMWLTQPRTNNPASYTSDPEWIRRQLNLPPEKKTAPEEQEEARKKRSLVR